MKYLTNYVRYTETDILSKILLLKILFLSLMIAMFKVFTQGTFRV